MRAPLSYLPIIILCACAPTLAPTSCSIPDAQTGDNGPIAFDTVVDYQETSGLSAAVGVGLPFPLALREADDGIDATTEGAATNLTLTVVAQGTGTARVLPLGVAQFVVFFDAADTYTLQA